MLRLAPYGLICFVESNDAANLNRDLSYPRVNRAYHYKKKHISSYVG